MFRRETRMLPRHCLEQGTPAACATRSWLCSATRGCCSVVLSVPRHADAGGRPRRSLPVFRRRPARGRLLNHKDPSRESAPLFQQMNMLVFLWFNANCDAGSLRPEGMPSHRDRTVQ
jgi:hypothetical protein